MSVLTRFRLAEGVTGIFCLGIGLFMWLDIWRMPQLAAKVVIGPSVFPALVGGGLVFLGLRLLYEAKAFAPMGHNLPQLDLKAALIGALAFLAMIFLLEPLGWIVAGTALYVCVAAAFGCRRHGFSLLIGLILTLGTFALFDLGLDLSLPLGTLFEPVIEQLFFQP